VKEFFHEQLTRTVNNENFKILNPKSQRPNPFFGKRNTVNGKRFLLVKELKSEGVKEFFLMDNEQ